MIALLAGFVSAPSAKRRVQTPGKSFKDYPDHTFNAREYIQGMTKGARNVLVWQDPSVDLRKYRSVSVSDFGGQLLPVQNVFSYDTSVSSFNATFQSSLKLHKEENSDALHIEGAVVECNPGSRAARHWVGFGAGSEFFRYFKGTVGDKENVKWLMSNDKGTRFTSTSTYHEHEHDLLTRSAVRRLRS